MTDFNDWYAKTNEHLDPSLDAILIELQLAYEAGAASQVGTLRDEFAGQALAAVIASRGGGYEGAIADWSYMMADAMLEARKTTGEGEA
tara:strand:+ start:596 stop:862 length:267 start_codon:yes stop_codon:yes gene_type:complete